MFEMGLCSLFSTAISVIVFHIQICTSQRFEKFGFGYMELAL